MSLPARVAEPAGRAVPPSMIAIAALLVGGFLAVSTWMVVTVSNGRDIAPLPDAADLPLPESVAVIDSHTTCRAEACDGHGLVLHWDPMVAAVAVDMLADHFAANAWMEDDGCAADARCLSFEDLRVMVRPWQDVDPGVGAVMRASIRDRGLDDSSFVYVKVYRCGIFEPCA